MSLCGGAIIANSSLSWWGAWLQGDAGKVVVPDPGLDLHMTTTT